MIWIIVCAFRSWELVANILTCCFIISITLYNNGVRRVKQFSIIAGFMLITCNKENRSDFQKLQNDILRICTLFCLADRVSIQELHTKCNIISLEQRMRKQLLWLMYILSKDVVFIPFALNIRYVGIVVINKNNN